MTNKKIGLMGERIQKERENLKTKTGKHFSLEAVANCLSVSRQTVSNWEKGVSSPTVSDLMRMCELFNCDFGYLVCEYEGRTRPETDIMCETGLTEKAVHTLVTMKDNAEPYTMRFINDLLSSPKALFDIAILYDAYIETLEYNDSMDGVPENPTLYDAYYKFRKKELSEYCIFRLYNSVVEFAKGQFIKGK